MLHTYLDRTILLFVAPILLGILINVRPNCRSERDPYVRWAEETPQSCASKAVEISHFFRMTVCKKLLFHRCNKNVISMLEIFKNAIALSESSTCINVCFCGFDFILICAMTFFKENNKLLGWLVSAVETKLFFKIVIFRNASWSSTNKVFFDELVGGGLVAFCIPSHGQKNFKMSWRVWPHYFASSRG